MSDDTGNRIQELDWDHFIAHGKVRVKGSNVHVMAETPELAATIAKILMERFNTDKHNNKETHQPLEQKVTEEPQNERQSGKFRVALLFSALMLFGLLLWINLT